MRVALISTCLEFPSSLTQRRDITLFKSSLPNSTPEADLYIWDFQPGFDVQRHILSRRSAQHLVLADSRNLEAINAIQNAACVLLKPVSPFTLKTFVELALENAKSRCENVDIHALRSDRDALLQYVLEVNLRLQEYDHERNNFLARALHDFRAPLTAVRGYCELLSGGKLGLISPAQRELLDRMSFSTTRLTKLTNGTLEMLLEGHVNRPLDCRAADIVQTLDRALHDIYPALHEKDIEVDIQMEVSAGILFFDPEKIQQVFVNLLENSSKFTPQNGTIVIRGCSIDRDESSTRELRENRPPFPANSYLVEIRDSGTGVQAYLAEEIFEEFATYAGDVDRSGGGLGLAICRAIISAHHGQIWAVPSENGAVFRFVLPMQCTDSRSVESAVQDQVVYQLSGSRVEERI